MQENIKLLSELKIPRPQTSHPAEDVPQRDDRLARKDLNGKLCRAIGRIRWQVPDIRELRQQRRQTAAVDDPRVAMCRYQGPGVCAWQRRLSLTLLAHALVCPFVLDTLPAALLAPLLVALAALGLVDRK